MKYGEVRRKVKFLPRFEAFLALILIKILYKQKRKNYYISKHIQNQLLGGFRSDPPHRSQSNVLFGKKVEDMSEKKSAAPAVAASAASVAEHKPRKAAGAAQHRGRPPLTPELYVEYGSQQYNITGIVDRAKADYRATHKVGVQSCKIYLKPEEGMAYYVINKVEGKLEL